MDAIRAVDVGGAGRPEQDRGARGEPHVGVAGGLGLVVGLGLHDAPRAAAVAQDAAHHVGRHLRHRAAGRRRDRPGRRSRPGGLVQLGEEVPGLRELVLHARARACRPRRPWTPARRRRAAARSSSESSWGASSESSASVSSDSRLPRSTAARTRPPTTPWASRNGTPRFTSRSATSVAASSSSPAPAAMRSRSKEIVWSIPSATARQSSTVSIASNSCSLSSWRSLL